MERLQKVIANAGVCSRRKAEELILAGKVKVNGHIVKELGTKVSHEDDVEVLGRHLTEEKKVYYMLNKPRGYVSTVSDDLGRKKVTDLIDTTARIYPIGRLDYDTTGLLLLTNDGELANILMHPSYEVSKTYLAKIEGLLSMEELHKLKTGITIDGRKCIPSRVKIKKRNIEREEELIEITIEEGRNHIIKRLFSALGHDVIKLKRLSYDFLDLGNLQSGEYRELSLKEVKKLYGSHQKR